MISAGAADTTVVEAAMELPAQGMQKPPRRVGEKRFLGGFSAAPDDEETSRSENETPLEAAGPLGRRWSAAASGAARHGVHGHAGLEAVQGDDLLSLPDLEGEGAGSPAEDGVGPL